MENMLFRKKTEIEKEKFRLRKIVEKIQKAIEERNTIQANIVFLEGQAGQLQSTIDQQTKTSLEAQYALYLQRYQQQQPPPHQQQQQQPSPQQLQQQQQQHIYEDVIPGNQLPLQ
ncbi:hypothetical protein RRG08_008981 [Elysia crispata]|uniref:Uncharacterized protein n=1 Tax=Elysia crispata TaxID=231223 RepID=A0AAE1DYS9_9GAST|nr:hypothetical protein RRG08_008981 [Elysia crispata]